MELTDQIHAKWEGQGLRDMCGLLARMTYTLTTQLTRLEELTALNNADRHVSEAAKRTLYAQRDVPLTGLSIPDSARVSKFKRALETDLARTARRDSGPSRGGGSSRPRRRDHRRGGGRGSSAAKAHATKWLVGQRVVDEQLLCLGDYDTRVSSVPCGCAC